MTLEQEALFANDTFYLAFTQKELPRDGAPVGGGTPGAVHPPRLARVAHAGRDPRELAPDPGKSAAARASISTNATAETFDSVVMVTCYEELPGSVCVATNGFVREGGDMRLFHHHSGHCANPPPPTRSGAAPGH